MKFHDETPSLFGQQEGPPEPLSTQTAPSVRLPSPDGTEESGPPSLSPDSEWTEVPQARFLSWSPQMQAAYCAARDEDAALCGWQPTMFFIERAEAYRCLAKS